MIEDLVVRAQRGDTIAMNELLDRLTPYVARICGPIALESGADAAQEALIAIFRRLRTLREPTALYGWARAIAVREAVRIARRRPVAVELDELPSREDVECAADIRDVLSRLSPEHRAVLMLRDLEGLEESVAAELLDLPVGTVKSRLHRARDNFRKAWSA
ncbi:RNA polymerase sigma factor [Streptosporangium sp. NPDC000396]|uniref:RNA polymerase sigma factor n=1 Tax=Streptosporangium sp. NPDC000396 TaxID=3366185 RepID=UPI003683E35E